MGIFKGKVKTWIFILLWLMSFSFFAGYMYQYHLPKLKSWALVSLQNISQKNLPIAIWAKDVDINPFTLSLEFKDIYLKPQEQLSTLLEKIKIQSIYLQIDPIKLLTSKVELKKIVINSISLKSRIETSQFSKKNTQNILSSKPQVNSSDSPLESFTPKNQKNSETQKNAKKDFFGILKKIPVEAIYFQNINANIQFKFSADESAQLQLAQGMIALTNNHSSLSSEINIPGIQWKQGDINIHSGLDLKTTLAKDKIIIDALKIKKGDNNLLASGQLDDQWLDGRFKNFHLKTELKIDTNSFSKIINQNLKNHPLPQLSGTLALTSYIESHNGNITSKNIISTSHLAIDQRTVGDIQGAFLLKDKILNIEKLSVQQSSGHVEIEDSFIYLEPPYGIKTNVKIKSLEISKLLKNIRIAETPLIIQTKGNLNCQGQVQSFSLFCKGALDLPHLQVWTGQRNNPLDLVNTQNIHLEGNVTVDKEKVSYSSKIKIPEGEGESFGEVSYQKGFNISYSGIIKDFQKSVPKIANFKIDGYSKVSGKTWGNSSFGRIEMDLDNKNLWFENYLIGNNKFHLMYKKGVLSFRKIQGLVSTSRYNGNISINFDNNQFLLDISSPFLNAKDIPAPLERTIKLPLQMTGTGTCSVHIDGPLVTNKLNYKIQTALFRGDLWGESYDQAEIYILGKNGIFTSQSSVIRKGDSSIQLDGSLDLERNLNLTFQGHKIKMEQIEFLNSLGLSIGGEFDFLSTLNGSFERPEFKLKGKMTQASFGDSAVNDSSFSLKINNDALDLEGAFLGKQVYLKTNIPFNETQPSDLQFKSNNWDFSKIFYILSKRNKDLNYTSRLTSELNIHSPKRWFLYANGFFNVEDLLIQKDDKFLKNKLPISISFKDGYMNANNFQLYGTDTYLKIQAKNSNFENISTQINAKFDADLLSIFVPFLDKLKGTISLALDLSGNGFQPNILGSAYFQNGSLKLNALPHSFENATGDVLFNQKTVLLNSFKSDFANGKLKASGKIKFNAFNDIPIDVTAQVSHAELNIPDGFLTRGDANLYFRGNNFPYTLGGSYKVQSGDISFSLLENKQQAKIVKPSEFLPQFLKNKNFEPIQLDLNVDLLNPVSVKTSISGAQVNAKVTGHIQVLNSPTQPLLNGAIKTEPHGTVTFRSNEFEIQSAIIEYKKQPPESPELFVNASANIQAKSNSTNSQNDTYEISMNVQGSAKNPNIILSSQPQLSKADIISLLALGVVSKNVDQSFDQSSAAIQSGFEVGTQILSEQLGLNKAVKNVTGFELDLVPFTDIDNSTAAKLSIKKQFSPKFEVSLGRKTGTTPSNDLKLEYKFNNNLSTIFQMEQQETGQNTDTTEANSNKEKLGLDLEYKVEFR